MAPLATWIFDELPPSGARRGGDPSEHAFRHDLETFVREVLQNANDQALTRPRVVLRLITLEGAALEAYRRASQWQTLESHARGAGSPAIRNFFIELDTEESLVCLNVEDHGTVGLVGAEDEGESHFRALCKDTLYSHKNRTAAGGSYGLGKSVLWSFSGISTVLFASTLTGDDAHRSPRFIGRAELASHHIGETWYSGSGWFGTARKTVRGERAESVWADKARELASKLHLERRANDPGTTIQIVGFREPAQDSDRDITKTAARMRDAVIKNFWPAMVMRRRALSVAVASGRDELEVDPLRAADVQPFIACYEKRNSTSTSATLPGDVAVRSVSVEVPGRRDGGAGVKAHATLIVRLMTASESDGYSGRVALVRGPGMVIRYLDRRNVVIGAPPFHAVLLAGEARADAPDDSDSALERFLLAAEPPGHDDWTSTPHVKELYKRGYGKALTTFFDTITRELSDVLTPTLDEGTRGPDALRKRFALGGDGAAGSAPSAFSIRGLAARLDDDGTWHFEGEVAPALPGVGWEARVALQELGEDGSVIRAVPIASLETADKRVVTNLNDGVGQFAADAATRLLRFSGRTFSYGAALRGELALEVNGKLYTEERLP